LGAAWSPNQEILLLATGNNSIISMDANFDPLNEVPIDDNNETIE